MARETIGRPMEILLVEDDLEDAGLTIEALRGGEVRCRVSLVCDGEERGGGDECERQRKARRHAAKVSN